MNPLLLGAEEPYEDSQVGSPRSATNGLPDPDALRQFYETQERERLERKLSKRSSTKSKHRNEQRKRPSVSSPPPPPPQQQQLPPPMQASRESLLEQPDIVPPMLLRTIIPDPLNELPAWYKKDELVPPVNPLSFKHRYPIHNPIGPRYYRNHHLLPPKGAVRPASFFSPSFPPMASFHTRSQDSQRLSRTPSGSPLPTPTSSQAEIGKRSRKTSQTTPDNVDMLDVTDPWGKNWHHTSPYDLNISTNSVAPENQEVSRPRLTSSATTRAPRSNKAVTPSPLSQSTSAVHLQVQDDSVRMTRKLSKRRTPVFGNLFAAPRDPKNRRGSLPAKPMDPNTPVRVALHDPPLSQQGKRSSTMPISASAVDLPSSGKERRSSILGRLVKKFSLMRKSTDQPSTGDWHHVEARDTERQSIVDGPATPKRVPPPQPPAEPDQRSSVSVELPARGRLTVANPDPSSTTSDTPVQRPITLPPEIVDQIIFSSPTIREPPKAPKTESSLPPTPLPKSPAPLPNRLSNSTVTESDATPRPPQPPQPSFLAAVDRSLPPTPMMQDSRPVSMSSTVANPPTTAYYQESPLSTASMIVNPPTPALAPERVISSVTAKETETFKLVKNPSGSLQADGEAWQVVENKDKVEKERNRLSDKERSRTSEKSKTSENDANKPMEKERSRSGDKDKRRLSKNKGDRQSASQPDRPRHKHSASTASVDKSLPDPHLERHSSSASRPLSELPSAAEMNSVKAKEAYELDRLWKARSMYNADQPSPNNRYVPSDSSSPVPESIRTIYGSSHTSFTVSSPFQSPNSLPSSHYTPHSQRQQFNSTKSDPVLVNGRSMNKLPDPPQESSYKSPIVSSLKGANWLTTTAH